MIGATTRSLTREDGRTLRRILEGKPGRTYVLHFAGDALRASDPWLAMRNTIGPWGTSARPMCSCTPDWFIIDAREALMWAEHREDGEGVSVSSPIVATELYYTARWWLG